MTSDPSVLGSPAPALRRSAVSDALWKSYRWMALGLAVSGVVALGVASSPTLLGALLGNRWLFLALMLVQFGLVAGFSAVARRASTAAAAAMFFAYAALTGVTLSTLLLVYTASSIATTFFVTAGSFAALSAYGALTTRDLSGVGRFALFALVGVLLVMLVNLFVRSSGLEFLVTLVGVVLFAALTAYDTQRLEELFAQGGTSGNLPLLGALTLYLDFLNLFLVLLRLTGNRRRG